MITGHGDEELASLAFRMGASGYAAKDRKLSVVLPDAVEWALDDATLKREATGEVDQRLEGLIEATHSASRDLRLELDAIASARQKLDKAVKSQDSEAIARAARAVSAIEKNVARSYSLIEKLDSLVSPQAGLEEVPPDGR
jgi:chromosome segregation ATPase